MQAETPPCFVNFRLPPELFRKLDDASRVAGVTRAELLRRAIRQIPPADEQKEQAA